MRSWKFYDCVRIYRTSWTHENCVAFSAMQCWLRQQCERQHNRAWLWTSRQLIFTVLSFRFITALKSYSVLFIKHVSLYLNSVWLTEDKIINSVIRFSQKLLNDITGMNLTEHLHPHAFFCRCHCSAHCKAAVRTLLFRPAVLSGFGCTDSFQHRTVHRPCRLLHLLSNWVKLSLSWDLICGH